VLVHTFQHLPGIRDRLERKLWARGFVTWHDLAEFTPSRADVREFRKMLDASDVAMEKGDAAFFGRRLPSREAWRVYREFSRHAVFVDIETTGSSRSSDAVTCIAVADHRGVRTFVRDRNLAEFPEAIRDASMIVTFNGAAFDLPFLATAFPAVRFEEYAHFDVCVGLRRLRVRGGLKRIEQDLGLPRDEGLAGVDGWLAVDLWHRHRGGDPRALPTLERYCAEDVLGLPALAAITANRMLELTPFSSTLEPLPVPKRIESFRPYSRELVREIVDLRSRLELERRALEDDRGSQIDGQDGNEDSQSPLAGDS